MLSFLTKEQNTSFHNLFFFFLMPFSGPAATQFQKHFSPWFCDYFLSYQLFLKEKLIIL